MKLLVCGGRDYKDRERVFDVLDRFHGKTKITVLIHGNANGADSLADEWAQSRGVQPARCPALWAYYHKSNPKAAGAIRNKAMLTLAPDQVIAFPGGRGTENMIRLAKEAGIHVLRCTSTEATG